MEGDAQSGGYDNKPTGKGANYFKDKRYFHSVSPSPICFEEGEEDVVAYEMREGQFTQSMTPEIWSTPVYGLESKGKPITLFTCPLCKDKGHAISRCPKNEGSGHQKRWQFVSKRFSMVAQNEQGKLPFYHTLEHGYVIDTRNLVCNGQNRTVTKRGVEAPVAGIPIINVTNLIDYAVPLYLNGTYDHCAIPIGSYLIGPVHGKNDKLTWAERKDGATIFHELEVIMDKNNVPMMSVADDVIVYRKPQQFRSVALSTEAIEANLDVFIVACYEGKPVMSGPTPLKEILLPRGPQVFKTLHHVNSSRVGMSGGALVSAATGKVVGMHLGCKGEDYVNFGVVLAHNEWLDTRLKAPAPKKTTMQKNNALAASLNLTPGGGVSTST
jgi:hypothetical protein